MRPPVLNSLARATSEREDGPAVQALDRLLQQAVQWDASDIHLEPRDGEARVRLRIDGLLHEVDVLPADLRDRVVSRIKVLSGLDIAERRVPQDGRVKVTIDHQALDCRVSTLPTLLGEKVVMRLLQPAAVSRDLHSLGYDPDQLPLVLQAVNSAQGMVLVTGPTGSGKTVSLYACLRAMNGQHLNISTVEDPVEIELEGINQVQVHEKAGLSFATALRAFLRQDPDVLMVGEIRDLETADMAVKAAQTGHLVLSTLHTNDAPSTLSRLMHMGVPSHLLAASLSLVIAQRLLRRLCDHCKTPVRHTDAVLIQAGLEPVHLTDQGRSWQAYAAQGCSACHGGLRGRLGVFQVMPVSVELQHLIVAQRSVAELGAHAAQAGVKTLRQVALDRMRSGLCTLEDVLSGTPH